MFWSFPPAHICLFLSNLVKASHAWVHAPAVPIYTDGSKSSEGVGYATVFPGFDMFISLPVVASIFTAELCAIFLTPFSHFVLRQ